MVVGGMEGESEGLPLREASPVALEHRVGVTVVVEEELAHRVAVAVWERRVSVGSMDCVPL